LEGTAKKIFDANAPTSSPQTSDQVSANENNLRSYSVYNINDLSDVFNHCANVYLFADGAKFYKHVLCDEDHKSLQCGLDALKVCSDKWLLKLNASKCETVYYGRNIDHGYKIFLTFSRA